MAELFPYQKEGIDFLVHTKRAILADEMGLGKTVQAILAAKAAGLTRILVICLKSLKTNWRREINLWWPEATTQIIFGNPVQREAQWEQDVNFHIVSYETMLRDEGMMEYDWQLTIADEAHKYLRNRKNKTFRCVKDITRYTPYVFLLTGTPIVKEPKDLWSMLNILDPHTFNAYWMFVKEHCSIKYNGFGYTITSATDPERTSQILSPWILRRTKASAGLHLPLKTVQQVWVKLSNVQSRHYKEMLQYCWTTLDDGVSDFTAVNIISQAIRLRQIALSLDLLQDTEHLRGAKVDALLDLLVAAESEPVVIFSQFKTALIRLQKILAKDGQKAYLYAGGMSDEERDTALKAFAEEPDARLLCVLQAGGAGLNMVNAHTAIFLDKAYAPADNVQAQDRLHRLGQLKDVMIYEILAENTIEETIEDILYRRTMDTDNILSGDILREAVDLDKIKNGI